MNKLEVCAFLILEHKCRQALADDYFWASQLYTKHDSISVSKFASAVVVPWSEEEEKVESGHTTCL